MFLKSFKRQPKVHQLIVKYPQAPRLPNGANAIMEHMSVSSLAMEVHQRQLRLVPMTSMEPYSEFVSNNPDHIYADAVWLDALIDTLAPNGKRSGSLEKFFLDGFLGQIFFLGTTFDSDAGPAYAFFNWSKVAPAGRYLCPVGNPVRPDVPVYAAVYEE